MCCVKVLAFLLVAQSGIVPLMAQKEPLFAALNSMIRTLRDEHTLLKAVESYLVERSSIMGHIVRVNDHWEILHYRTQRALWKNKEDYVARFKLIQRMTRLWNVFKFHFLDKTSQRGRLNEVYTKVLLPDDKDIRGFTRLLVLNADIYNKSIAELLTPRSPFVTVDELLDLSFRIRQHHLGLTYHDTLLKVERVALFGLTDFHSTSAAQGGLTLSRVRYHQLSALTDELYESGLWNVGYNFSQTLHRLFPGDEEFDFKVKMFANRLKRSGYQDKIGINPFQEEKNPDKDAFASACRQQELVLGTGPELKCYYFHKNQHLRHVAAYKVEEVSQSPVIRLYHDVLQDGEIQLMQAMAFPILRTALVFSTDRKSSELSEYRISNNGWFFDPDGNATYAPQPPEIEALYRTLNQRMEDCTGLNKRGTESIQMNNYGVGGHYAWHYDALYYVKTDQEEVYPNDRIATWMFYLNDVKEGGNTVFPRLNISLPPRRGSAVFWYNLHPSGNLDDRTLHGGCPILQGTKWVANLWVHEFEQTFVHLCPLGGETEPEPWVH